LKDKQDSIDSGFVAASLAIKSEIGVIRKNDLIYQQENFEARLKAIDFVDFHILGRIEALLQTYNVPDELLQLKAEADEVKTALEEIDTMLFTKLREDIRTGVYKQNAFKDLVAKYVAAIWLEESNEAIGYDDLDVFINGLLSAATIPEPLRTLEPEMVFYQKTPARLVFELVEKVAFAPEDVLIDIGCGLGQVPIIVNLLTGIKTKGIEYEPAFCGYADECAAGLNLANVAFISTDARQADYSAGTVFFIYTPFKGEMLQQVLGLLKQQAQARQITLITYGPCTLEVALQNWLTPKGVVDSIYKTAIFTSNYPG
jgi:precorrin-6B methylase 2